MFFLLFQVMVVQTIGSYITILVTISGDGCLDDWKLYNNSCYYISDLTDSFSNIRWSDAKLKCNTLAPNKNAHLLQLETKKEQVCYDVYFPLFKVFGNCQVHMILNDYIHVFVFFICLFVFLYFYPIVVFFLHNLYISCFIGVSPQ